MIRSLQDPPKYAIVGKHDINIWTLWVQCYVTMHNLTNVRSDTYSVVETHGSLSAYTVVTSGNSWELDGSSGVHSRRGSRSVLQLYQDLMRIVGRFGQITATWIIIDQFSSGVGFQVWPERVVRVKTVINRCRVLVSSRVVVLKKLQLCF